MPAKLSSIGGLNEAYQEIYDKSLNQSIEPRHANAALNAVRGSKHLNVELPLKYRVLQYSAMRSGKMHVPISIPWLDEYLEPRKK